MFRGILTRRKDKFLPVYEINIKRTREFDPKQFKFRNFNACIKGPPGREAMKFFEEAALTYAIYLSVEEVKTFNELIKKLNSFVYSDIKPHLIEMNIGKMRLFNFEINYEKHYLQYFKLYIISKWLGLKPNKDFKPIFEQVALDLKDKVWW